MGALSSLNLASNNLGEPVPPEGWEKNGSYYRQGDQHPWTETVPDGAKPQGIIAIANAIPDMGALVKLDISGNNDTYMHLGEETRPIGAEQEEDLQRICVASGIELAM
jgi:hypothetical protein